MLMNERVWKDFIRFFVVKVAPFATSILSLYFLASSSPNKGDVFESEVFVCINPLALRALPLYFAAQNTGGGEGEVYISLSPRLRCYSKRPVMLRSTAGGEGEMYIPFVSASMLFKTPRHVTGYGRRERVKKH